MAHADKLVTQELCQWTFGDPQWLQHSEGRFPKEVHIGHHPRQTPMALQIAIFVP